MSINVQSFGLVVHGRDFVAFTKLLASGDHPVRG
jgi:hypothetical protein